MRSRVALFTGKTVELMATLPQSPSPPSGWEIHSSSRFHISISSSLLIEQASFNQINTDWSGVQCDYAVGARIRQVGSNVSHDN